MTKTSSSFVNLSNDFITTAPIRDIAKYCFVTVPFSVSIILLGLYVSALSMLSAKYLRPQLVKTGEKGIVYLSAKYECEQELVSIAVFLCRLELSLASIRDRFLKGEYACLDGEMHRIRMRMLTLFRMRSYSPQPNLHTHTLNPFN